jgi:hypothetical protein
MIAEGVFGGFTTDVYYESYRMLDGIMMPLLVSEFSPDFGSVRRLRTVTHGGAPDPAVFVKPEK